MFIVPEPPICRAAGQRHLLRLVSLNRGRAGCLRTLLSPPALHRHLPPAPGGGRPPSRTHLSPPRHCPPRLCGPGACEVSRPEADRGPRPGEGGTGRRRGGGGVGVRHAAGRLGLGTPSVRDPERSRRDSRDPRVALSIWRSEGAAGGSGCPEMGSRAGRWGARPASFPPERGAPSSAPPFAGGLPVLGGAGHPSGPPSLPCAPAPEGHGGQRRRTVHPPLRPPLGVPLRTPPCVHCPGRLL